MNTDKNTLDAASVEANRPNTRNGQARRWTFTVPPTMEQGSHVGVCSENYYETYRKNALWDYNSARAHDGLPPIARMPNGTRYNRIAASENQASTLTPEQKTK